MKTNYALKTPAIAALTGLVLLVGGASSLFAHEVSQQPNQPTDFSNGDLTAPSQTYPPPQQGVNPNAPWIGPRHMMGPGQHMMGPGSGRGNRWGYGPQRGMMFNPNTVETVRGRVVSVEPFTPMQGMSQGRQLLIQTGDETVPVHLGPAWYLNTQELPLAPNDEVEVVGSRMPFAGNSTIIASEIRRGDERLILRNNQGYPAWSGWSQQNGRWGPGRACCW